MRTVDPQNTSTYASPEPRSFAQLLRLLARWWWVFVLVTLVTVGAALAYSLTRDTEYRADAEVLINRQSLAKSLNNIVDVGAQATEGSRALEAQAGLATSPTVIDRTIKSLGLSESPAEVRERIEVTADLSADVLEFRATGPTEAAAIALANETAKQYIAYSSEVDSAQLAKALEAVESSLRKIARSRDMRESTTFANLVANRNVLRSLAVVRSTDAELISPAASADKVQPRNLKLVLAVSATLGLLLSIGLVLVLGSVDPRVHGSRSIAAALGASRLVRVPKRNKKSPTEPVTLSAPDGAAAESYRFLRAELGLAQNSTEGPARPSRVLVTSCGGSGSALATALNLAVTESRAGNNTRLIELSGAELPEAFAVNGSVPLGPGGGVLVPSVGPLEVVGREHFEGSEEADLRATVDSLDSAPVDGLTIFAAPDLLDSEDAVALLGSVDQVVVAVDTPSARSSELDAARRLIGDRPQVFAVVSG